MLRSSEMGLNPDERSAHDELLVKLPEEFRALFEWTLAHRDELTSCFLRRNSVEIVDYATRMLGSLGDEASAKLLRRFANDPAYGTSARAAVREIEARANASGPRPLRASP
jgi:hypothetical protein